MDEVIKISPQEYKRLIQTEAKVQSLMAYASQTRYIENKLIFNIFWISENGVEDGEIGKSHGE